MARKDSRSVHSYCTRIAAVLAATLEAAEVRVATYRVSMYASANSCVGRLNTEGDRDPASRLTQIADKRREQAKPAETDKQKQERFEPERDRSRRSAQPANGRDKNLSA